MKTFTFKISETVNFFKVLIVVCNVYQSLTNFLWFKSVRKKAPRSLSSREKGRALISDDFSHNLKLQKNQNFVFFNSCY